MAALYCIITNKRYAPGDPVYRDSKGERFCVSLLADLTDDDKKKIRNLQAGSKQGPPLTSTKKGVGHAATDTGTTGDQ